MTCTDEVFGKGTRPGHRSAPVPGHSRATKTLRHSTLATTVNLYGHLLPHAARDAVAAIDTALERADRKHATGDPGGASEQRAA
ncbi:hypothetical protein ACWDHW_45435 [Streptomyces melanosporofaciens]|uniref:hypothetical protein n=1 Tax=unclassified Streptomyces TaxID=2593676 RepID=UPI0036996DFF